eukprot:6226951-Alexandrium_andersonii.AAC.1
MQRILSLTGSQVTKCQMGAFVGPTAKDTLLNGCAPFLHKLARCMTDLDKQDIKANPMSLCDNYVDINGKKRCTGLKRLKLSQSYPIGFGAAFALEFVTYLEKPIDARTTDGWDPAVFSWEGAEADSDSDEVFSEPDCFADVRVMKRIWESGVKVDAPEGGA